MMKKTFFLYAFLGFALLTGCVAQEVKPDPTMMAGNLVITEAQDSAEIAVQVGRSINVRLPSNRSTGYQWVQTEPMRGILRDASPTHEQATPDVPGSGGTDVFPFVAARPGKQILQFEYRRAWTGDTPSDQKVKYIIVVE
jgi:Predicted secreted protein